MEGPPPELGPYVLVRSLGAGTTGKVKLAIHRETNQQCAIKIISKASFEKRPNLQSKIQREIALMRLVDHPHLLRLIDVLESPRHLYMVLEYASRGELFDYLVAHRVLSDEIAARFFRQIVYGLEYLHSLGICHRDLKPENILLDENLNIKIADFGFARFVKTNIAETSCGSPHYAAPEVIRGEPYDGRSADVWSCGVILYALLAGYLPFDDPSIRVLLAKVRSGMFQMPAFSEMAKDFIGKLLVLDPSQRIRIEDMKMHPYFRLSLPADYVIPAPLPIPSFVDPVDPTIVPAEVIDVLHKIGYNDDEELFNDLAASQHSMAKVFYYMLTSRVAIDQLDWTQSVGSNSNLQANDEAFIMDPSTTAFTVNGTDPFHRYVGPNAGSSYEVATSLAFRPEWAMPETEAMEIMQSHDIVSHMNVVFTMRAIQGLMAQLEMPWFHPDDFMIIARHETLGIYVVFQCSDCIAEEETRMQIQLCHGTTESFRVVCQGAEEIINAMQGGLICGANDFGVRM